jgi:uncharacterized protein (DUF58 family)
MAATTVPGNRRSRRAATGVLGWIEARVGVTLSGLVVALFCVLGWFAARALGGRALYLLVYIGVVALGASIAIARRHRAISATRSDLAHRCRVGQVLDVEVSVHGDRKTTAFVLEETVHPHLGTTVRVPVAEVSPGQDFVHTYSFTPRLRGVYELGPLVAEFSDPLALAKSRQTLAEPVEVIVHPTTDDVLDRPLTRAFEDPPLRPPASRPWPEGFEFYGMRDYVPGDDVRRVVWNAFARTRRLLVREFEQGINDRVVVVLDTDESWHSPGVPSDTFETAVRVAASVGVRHIKEGLTVALHSGYAQLGSGTRGFRGPKSHLPFLDELARVRLSKEPLSAAFRRIAGGPRHDAHFVIVTGHLDSDSTATAALLTQAGASFTVCCVVWEESDPLTVARAHEIGAQVVQVKPGASLSGVFRASLQTRARALHK